MSKKDWFDYSLFLSDLCDATFFKVADLYRFNKLILTVLNKPDFINDIQIGIELSNVEGRLVLFPDDEQELSKNFLDAVLPKYSFVFLISIMETFFSSIRVKVEWNKIESSKGFGLPIPPIFSKKNIDEILAPLIGEYLFAKSVRNIIVHNNGLIDAEFLRRNQQIKNLRLGEQFIVTQDILWDTFVACRNIITQLSIISSETQNYFTT